MENSLQSAAEMPYFEGDFWPNVLEESIRELDIVSYYIDLFSILYTKI